MVSTVRATLEKTPPELAADIIDRGMVLTGGGAQLRNIAQLLTQETGVPAYVAENPIACVALGAGRALENYEIMRRSLPIVPELRCGAVEAAGFLPGDLTYMRDRVQSHVR